MTKIYNRNTGNQKRRVLRNNATAAEKMLWARLRSRQLSGIKFRRQYGIGPYITDFYSPELRLVIEVDGDSHFTAGALEYDAVRDEYMKSIGIRIMRFTNLDILNNIDGVLTTLLDAMNRTTPLSPPLVRGEAGHAFFPGMTEKIFFRRKPSPPFFKGGPKGGR